MYTKQPKKLLIFNILDILRRYTDENHHLSQKEIEEILENEYDMPVDRKSIKTNLMNLIDFGYEIEYSESIRPYKNKKTGEIEESSVLTDFYLVREFNDSELRLLIDSLLFSTHLPYSQCKELVGKLEKQSSKYFHNRVKHIATMPQDMSDNKTIFYNIDVIDDAISANKKIEFNYVDYDINKKPQPKKDANGNLRKYVVSPYQMVAKEGKYYVICNYDPYDDVANYRIDRILNIKMIDEKAKSFKQLKGANGQQLNLSAYMKEHIYMYSSDSNIVKFRIINAMIIDMIDLFGKEVRFMDQDETHVTAMVKVNNKAALQFAKNYAPHVVVLEPKELRERVIAELKRGIQGYECEYCD